MKKKMTIGLGLALLVMISIASLAYFTDIKSGETNVVAGNVSLNDNTVAVDTDLMVPGDTKALSLSAIYTGNVEAKVRVKLSGLAESVPATLTEGFKLNNDSTPVDLSGDVFIDAADVNTSGDLIELPLEIELLAASKNIYQDATFSANYEIQVLQAENTTWSTIDQGLIVAK